MLAPRVNGLGLEAGRCRKLPVPVPGSRQNERFVLHFTVTLPAAGERRALPRPGAADLLKLEPGTC